jgi:hypothetical protein
LTIQNLKDIYDEVVDDIYPKIKVSQGGILYQTIQIIFEEEDISLGEKTSKICEYLNVKKNGDFKDDDEIISKLVENIFDKQFRHLPFKEQARSYSRGLDQNSNSKRKNMEEIKWIVLVGCTLVGAYFCIQYIEKVKRKRATKTTGQNRETRVRDDSEYVTRRSIPADLCLVVPAKVVGNLSVRSVVSSEDLSYLIDNTSYFLCASKENADINERDLIMSEDEDILPDSNRDVYIRVKIENGQNLIGEKIPYYLKSGLSTNSKITIKKVTCLGSMSGLQTFNRI